MASSAPSKAVTLVGPSTAARSPNRSRTPLTTSRPAKSRLNTPQKADTFTTAKGEPDWKAYIDVDLSEQHARYYDESGNIVWEANFISGKPGEDATPEGVWQINSNDGGSTLIGAKDETGKPKYESPVSYWMPFEGAT